MDSKVKGGMRWPLGKESVSDRYIVVGVWHTKSRVYKSSFMRLKIRQVDRFDFRTSTGDVAQDARLRIPELTSQLRVAERSLFLWNNDRIRNLITQNQKVILPIIFPALEKNTRTHWNQAVQSLNLNVRKKISDADPELFEECLIRYQEGEAKEKEIREKRETTWKRLEDFASSKVVSNKGVLVSRIISSLSLGNTSSPRSSVS